MSELIDNNSTSNPDKLIILDIANNHFGSVDHAKKIIKNFSSIDNPKGFKIIFKLQFRNLDSFIHPKAPSDSHYVQRFNSTRLEKKQLLEIAQYINDLDKDRFGLMITPFDEDSVDWSLKAKTDFIKVASWHFV